MQEQRKDDHQTLEKLFEGLSYERMSTYLQFSNNDKEKALKLYIHNTRISESFYTSLQGLEVLLRNSVHKAVSRKYGERWLFNTRFPFEYIQKKTLEDALAKAKVELTTSKLIAELNLGFWVSLFGRKYEEVWRHSLRSIFRQEVLTRKELHIELSRIRELRNRIAHHEPIFKRQLEEDHTAILKVIHMICPITGK
jgi:hypothetical protein